MSEKTALFSSVIRLDSPCSEDESDIQLFQSEQLNNENRNISQDLITETSSTNSNAHSHYVSELILKMAPPALAPSSTVTTTTSSSSAAAGATTTATAATNKTNGGSIDGLKDDSSSRKGEAGGDWNHPTTVAQYRCIRKDSTLSHSQVQHCSIPNNTVSITPTGVMPQNNQSVSINLRATSRQHTTSPNSTHREVHHPSNMSDYSNYVHERDELLELRRAIEEMRETAWFKNRVTTVQDKSTQTSCVPTKVWVSDQAVDTTDLPTSTSEENQMNSDNHSTIICANGGGGRISSCGNTIVNNCRNQSKELGNHEVGNSPLGYGFMNWFNNGSTPFNRFSLNDPSNYATSYRQSPNTPWFQPSYALTSQTSTASTASAASTVIGKSIKTNSKQDRSNSITEETSSFWEDPLIMDKDKKERNSDSKKSTGKKLSLDKNLEKLCSNLSLSKKKSDDNSCTNSLSSNEKSEIKKSPTNNILKKKTGNLLMGNKIKSDKIDSISMNNFKYRRTITLLPNDAIILSYLNPNDRRLRSAATKNDVTIHIDGPISVCNPSLKCQALRNHLVYQFIIGANTSGKVEKCIHYMRETFEGTSIK